MPPLEGLHRYAVYYAPPRLHALWRTGATLLGRDPESGEALPQPPLEGIAPDRFAAITADPRRYGWHATLKPPFALADGTDAEMLDAALSAFASARRGFAMPRLVLGAPSGFLALVPDEPSDALDALAADCVSGLDRFRAPAGEQELARRRRTGLTAEEEENLASWGYPYVMGRFRFHMTLTQRLEPAERARVADALSPHLSEALASPLAVDGIALYGEPAPGAPFSLLRRYGFGD